MMREMAAGLAAKLLFETEVVGEPLFKSSGDLARDIARQPNATRTNEHALATFLGQILVRGDRPCPDDLLDSISKAAKERASARHSPKSDDLGRRIERALKAEKLAKSSPQPLGAEELYAELLDEAETAAHHFIITNKPVEQIRSRRTEALQGILLRRLGLLDLVEDGKALAAPTTSYTFCLPTPEACLRWWRAVLGEMLSHRRLKIAGSSIGTPTDNRMERFRQLAAERLGDLDDAGHIRAYSVNPLACGCPVVVFNPDSPEPVGFNLYYLADSFRGEDFVSVCKMGRSYVADWIENVYRILQDEVIIPGVGRVGFREALSAAKERSRNGR